MDDVHRLIHAVRHRSCGVELMEEGLQLLHDADAVRQDLVPYLVTGGPEHDGRVVAEMLDHVGDVPFPPVVELDVVVIVGLAVVPDVERLDAEHDSHLVAELHEFRRGHVMTRSDGVAPHLFEHGQLVAQGVFMNRHAERTEVMVETHAFELTGLAVELKTVLGGVADRADTKGGVHFVDDLLVFIDARARRVDIRRLGAP